MKRRHSLPLAALLLAALAWPASASAAPDAAAVDRALTPVLRSGCRQGLAELRALVEGAGDSADVAVARRVLGLCGRVIAEAPAPRLAPPALVDNSGRGKLVFASTLYGLWAGVAFDIVAGVDGGRAIVVAPLIGVGAGLALSYWATRDAPITSGQAWTVITGMDYGTYSGLLWAAVAGADTKEGIIGTSLVTGAAGAAVATAVAKVAAPAQGHVELVRSGGLWGFTTGALVAALVQPSEQRAVFALMGGGMDLGLLAGGLLSQIANPSRNRMLLIDSATLAGGLGGFALSFLALGKPGTDNDWRVLAGAALGGLYGGMLTGVYLTRNMHAEAQEARAPIPALIARDTAGGWGLGRLAVLPVVTPEGGGARVTGAMAPVLGGVF